MVSLRKEVNWKIYNSRTIAENQNCIKPDTKMCRDGKVVSETKVSKVIHNSISFHNSRWIFVFTRNEYSCYYFKSRLIGYDTFHSKYSCSTLL